MSESMGDFWIPATPLREANQQRVDAAAQRVRQAMDYRKYLPDDPFRKDVELLIEIALAPVLEIFAAAQPATAPGSLEEWLEAHRVALDERQLFVVKSFIVLNYIPAAQPQRESEQLEQVAKLTDKILTKLFKQYSGKEFKSFRHALRRTLEPIMRAALALQTDSQEPR